MSLLLHVRSDDLLAPYLLELLQFPHLSILVKEMGHMSFNLTFTALPVDLNIFINE